MTDSPISGLFDLLEADMMGTDRNLQTRIGPSGLGTTCDRCLVHGLAETPQYRHPNWWAGAGTAIHEWCEGAILRHTGRVLRSAPAGESTEVEWLPENRVAVGNVLDVEISGTADVFHVPSGTVGDFKCLGKSSLEELKRGNVKTIYRRQLMLYGRGYENEGYTVNHVALIGIPRDAKSIRDGSVITMPYDRMEAETVLKRASVWLWLIRTNGLEATLGQAGEHNREEFSCSTYPDFMRAPTISFAPAG